ncbi:hypothetical protein ACQCVB_04950 [Fictibacillus phosphorivorans]|uniref:hypothetical protein n=1 Tax=Fictibacillus phosphorivorans TaxID=1221500 RepID=UPI003CEF8676
MFILDDVNKTLEQSKFDIQLTKEEFEKFKFVKNVCSFGTRWKYSEYGYSYYIIPLYKNYYPHLLIVLNRPLTENFKTIIFKSSIPNTSKTSFYEGFSIDNIISDTSDLVVSLFFDVDFIVKFQMLTSIVKSCVEVIQNYEDSSKLCDESNGKSKDFSYLSKYNNVYFLTNLGRSIDSQLFFSESGINELIDGVKLISTQLKVKKSLEDYSYEELNDLYTILKNTVCWVKRINFFYDVSKYGITKHTKENMSYTD